MILFTYVLLYLFLRVSASTQVYQTANNFILKFRVSVAGATSLSLPYHPTVVV